MYYDSLCSATHFHVVSGKLISLSKYALYLELVKFKM